MEFGLQFFPMSGPNPRPATSIGTRLCARISDFIGISGGFEIASPQVDFNDPPIEHAEASTRLFGERAIPKFA